MRRGLGPLLIVGVWCSAAWFLPVASARAADGTGQSTNTAPPTAEAKASAQEHFTRAKDLYASGKYQDAIGELELAHGLDPSAKDLVFNLGSVSEKLARFDDALKYYRMYLTMDVTPAERSRAEGYIRRVEGAKRALPPPPPSASAAPTTSGSGSQPPPPPKDDTPEKRPHGRIDAATITAAAVGVAGIGVGTVLGVKALKDVPPSNSTTNKSNPYSNLQSKQDSAHKEAFISDIGFAVGGAGLIAAAVLYFAREKDKPAEQKPTDKTADKTADRLHFTGMNPVATPHGATLFLGGEF